MDSLNVQFSDAKETTVISYFASPQDPETFPIQGTVTPADPRWVAYWNAVPTVARQYLPAPA